MIFLLTNQHFVQISQIQIMKCYKRVKNVHMLFEPELEEHLTSAVL